MEWWTILRIVWAGVALVGALTAVLILMRARGALSWHRSLKSEIDALDRLAADADLPTRKALGIIQDRCRSILTSYSANIGELRYLTDYIHSLAVCFHPVAQRPELQVGVGAFLHSLENSLQRFDSILQRRGFSKLRALNIRHVKRAWRWYAQISASRFYRMVVRYQENLREIASLRFLLYLDPFIWLAFLSNRLTVLILIKYLLVDLYLYMGVLAIEAFEEDGTTLDETDVSKDELEEVLEELEAAEVSEPDSKDPAIDAIRNRLIGFPAIITSNPGFAEYKAAVVDAAVVIAGRFFPEARNPLDEAAIGPLLDRTRTWIATISKGEEYLLARRLYQIRLETLWQAKNISDMLLPGFLTKFIEKAYRTYGWFKWPFRVYRWAKKRSPWGIALEIGWQAAKKVTLVQIYGRTFDRACYELERVYRESKALHRSDSKTADLRLRDNARDMETRPEPDRAEEHPDSRDNANDVRDP